MSNDGATRIRAGLGLVLRSRMLSSCDDLVPIARSATETELVICAPIRANRVVVASCRISVNDDTDVDRCRSEGALPLRGCGRTTCGTGGVYVSLSRFIPIDSSN